jgi:NAD(P)H-dependent FMN reductase
MKISLISTSHQQNSESSRVRKIFEKQIIKQKKDLNTFDLDFSEEDFYFWYSDNKNKNTVWKEKWQKISEELKNSQGFVFVVPEYGGMATPIAKNFFLICNKGELAHKPGLIVSISSGNGGAYPVSELRSSSYKNTHIMWIPEQIIIRNVEQFQPGEHGLLIPAWMDKRIHYTLDLLIAYAECMKPLSKLINRKDFGNGM